MRIQTLILERPQKQVGMYTQEAIARTLGKDREWVALRIKELGLKSTLNQDKSGRSKPHYPQQVIDTLQEILDEVKDIPEVGDFLSISQVANALGKSDKWVYARLSLIPNTSEKRMNRNKNIYKYYSPRTIEFLRAFLD
jgi:hypothetical protein